MTGILGQQVKLGVASVRKTVRGCYTRRRAGRQSFAGGDKIAELWVAGA
jgi:hypothetical protein